MSSQPEAKRAKISPDVGTIACRLNELVRGDLEKVARAGITESPAALNLAKTLISMTESRMLHCVRCHENFDPHHTGNTDCVMEGHDDTNGMIRCRSQEGYDAFAHPCCEKMEDDYDPCFAGPHISTYEYGDYWGDFDLEEINQDGDCSKCNPEDDDDDEEKEEDVIVID